MFNNFPILSHIVQTSTCARSKSHFISASGVSACSKRRSNKLDFTTHRTSAVCLRRFLEKGWAQLHFHEGLPWIFHEFRTMKFQEPFLRLLKKLLSFIRSTVKSRFRLKAKNVTLPTFPNLGNKQLEVSSFTFPSCALTRPSCSLIHQSTLFNHVNVLAKKRAEKISLIMDFCAEASRRFEWNIRERLSLCNVLLFITFSILHRITVWECSSLAPSTTRFRSLFASDSINRELQVVIQAKNCVDDDDDKLLRILSQTLFTLAQAYALFLLLSPCYFTNNKRWMTNGNL